jgi:RNA polymerase sigma-70 factor (ECF subfamily)
MKDGDVVSHEQEDAGAEGRLDAQALFRAHAVFVASFLQRLGTPAADVDDLVQEVFLVVHRKGGYVPGAGRPRTWLAAIALRVARTGRRTRGRRREQPDDDALRAAASSAATPEAELEARLALARMQRALDCLDLEHRAAFVLYELDGESCEAIASAFGVPIGTVYSRLHHARRRFTSAYAALGGEDGASRLRPRLMEGT